MLLDPSNLLIGPFVLAYYLILASLCLFSSLTALKRLA